MELLGYSALSLLLIKYFSPLQPVRERLVTWLIRVMATRQWFWLEHIIKVISCPFCFATWFTLAMTLNVWDAAIVGILTMVINSILEALNKYNYGDN